MQLDFSEAATGEKLEKKEKSNFAFPKELQFPKSQKFLSKYC